MKALYAVFMRYKVGRNEIPENRTVFVISDSWNNAVGKATNILDFRSETIHSPMPVSVRMYVVGDTIHWDVKPRVSEFTFQRTGTIDSFHGDWVRVNFESIDAMSGESYGIRQTDVHSSSITKPRNNE